MNIIKMDNGSVVLYRKSGQHSLAKGAVIARKAISASLNDEGDVAAVTKVDGDIEIWKSTNKKYVTSSWSRVHMFDMNDATDSRFSGDQLAITKKNGDVVIYEVRDKYYNSWAKIKTI